ncbi:hypothetical protein J3E69DRAFT_13482 [Trichoderma sp. SZMC 28015]
MLSRSAYNCSFLILSLLHLLLLCQYISQLGTAMLAQDFNTKKKRLLLIEFSQTLIVVLLHGPHDRSDKMTVFLQRERLQACKHVTQMKE